MQRGLNGLICLRWSRTRYCHCTESEYMMQMLSICLLVSWLNMRCRIFYAGLYLGASSQAESRSLTSLKSFVRLCGQKQRVPASPRLPRVLAARQGRTQMKRIRTWLCLHPLKPLARMDQRRCQTGGCRARCCCSPGMALKHCIVLHHNLQSFQIIRWPYPLIISVSSEVAAECVQ
jgi:hypothetical protein